ncbi:hypothetical protein KEM55_008430 [Ascosphaera atra]|nr:hypothetical protein KEM55_008430 [Ascosphaera atra]
MPAKRQTKKSHRPVEERERDHSEEEERQQQQGENVGDRTSAGEELSRGAEQEVTGSTGSAQQQTRPQQNPQEAGDQSNLALGASDTKSPNQESGAEEQRVQNNEHQGCEDQQPEQEKEASPQEEQEDSSPLKESDVEALLRDQQRQFVEELAAK